MDDRTLAKALELGFALAEIENKGSRFVVKPERVGELAARIVRTMRKNLDALEPTP